MNTTANPQIEPVLFEERDASGGGRIGFITLNRPRQLNALTLRMCELMLAQLRTWQSDTGIVAVLMQGAGDKGFCAGGDVADVVRNVRAGGDQRFVYGDTFFDVEYQLDYLIHTFAKPFIAYAHGICMGGGMGLVAGASHRIVSDGARIAMPEIHIGLFPDVGGGFFLNRVPGGAGRLMALTGVTINEADALFAGLADGFVPLEERDAFIDDLVGLPWTVSAIDNRVLVSNLVLSRMRRYSPGLPESNLRMYFDAIRFIAAMPTVIGLRDALVAAANEDPWFQPMADNLSRGSPTTAHVAFEYLRRCHQMSLRQVLDLDLVLARNFQRHRDFCEGVRALLIDKDRKPVWSPDRFEAVEKSLVDAHFRAD